MEKPPNSKVRTSIIWLALIAVFLGLFLLSSSPDLPRVDFVRFLEEVEAGQVGAIRIESNEVFVENWGGYEYVTLGVVDDALQTRLSEQGVVIRWGPEEKPYRTLLLVGVPLIALLALFLYFLKKQSGMQGNIFELRKSTAKVIEGSKVTFDHVGGCEDAKEALRDVVDFLKNPKRWTDAGVRLPRGVLLEGPPGCGKTLLARAVAGETDAKFYLVSASEFVEMFVGVGAARVRDTFEAAAKSAPAVVFIDELDAVGRRRGSGIGAAHDEREQTLNQILVNMDGFENDAQVVVIAATNRSDVLDEALMRPGRFDRRIAIPPLSRDQRIDVLKIHCAGKPLSDAVSLEEVADKTPGWTGAQLESLANEAGLLAVRRARQGVDADGAVELLPADIDSAWQPRSAREREFDSVDALLVESVTQIARAKGKARVRVTLTLGTVVEGQLVWADASFVKVEAEDGSAAVVAKSQIQSIEALEGTAWADDVAPDRLAGRTSGLA